MTERCSPHKYNLYLTFTLFVTICTSQFLCEELHFLDPKNESDDGSNSGECLKLNTRMPHNDLDNGRGVRNDVASWRQCGK